MSYPVPPNQLRPQLLAAWTEEGWVVSAQSKYGVSASKLGQFVSASLVRAPAGTVLVVSLVNSVESQ